MYNRSKVSDEVLSEFYARFANGEQYLQINPLGQIEEVERYYFWQSNEVFNILKVIVDTYYPKKLNYEQVFNRGGLVELLLPLQRSYNTVKNRELEYINRITNGIVCVESGSVDTDCLEEEGLTPGKILVYRQNCNKPEFNLGSPDTMGYIQSAQELERSMWSMAESFVIAHSGEASGGDESK